METVGRAAALIVLVMLTSCAKKIETEIQDAVRNWDDVNLTKEDVEVVSVRTTGSSAVSEVKIRTAIQLRKSDDRWIVEEIRLGDRDWLDAELLARALRAERVRSTGARLDEVYRAVEAFRAEHRDIPRVETFEALVDVLGTAYLDSSARLDAWSRTMSYRVLSESDFELRSAGPDGRMNTADDLIKRSSH